MYFSELRSIVKGLKKKIRSHIVAYANTLERWHIHEGVKADRLDGIGNGEILDVGLPEDIGAQALEPLVEGDLLELRPAPDSVVNGCDARGQRYVPDAARGEGAFLDFGEFGGQAGAQLLLSGADARERGQRAVGFEGSGADARRTASPS